MSWLIHWLTESQHYFQSLGIWGIFLFAALCVGVQLCMSPLAPLAVAAGMFFGFWGGLGAVELGTGGGIVLNFLLARYIARNAIAHRLAKNEKFRVIDSAIGREGGKIIFLLRFCPIPFGLSNFCYGLTAVRFWPYLLASVAGIIPGNVFFTWVGATAESSLEDALHQHHTHPFQYLMMFLALVGGVSALTYVSRVAKAAVANHTPEPLPAAAGSEAETTVL